MKEPVLIVCPYHMHKKFFKCTRCEEIEVFCEHCKATYMVAVTADENGIKQEFKLVKQSA